LRGSLNRKALPSGAKTAGLVQPSSYLQVATFSPSVVFHRASPLRSPQRASAPSGESPMFPAPSPSGLNLRVSLPVATSQTLKSEKPAVRATLPSAETAIRWTCLWASTLHTSFPVSTSQSRRVPSYPPERAFLPSGRKATQPTQELCPANFLTSLPV